MTTKKANLSGDFKALVPKDHKTGPEWETPSEENHFPGALQMVCGLFEDIMFNEYGVETPPLEGCFIPGHLGDEDHPSFSITLAHLPPTKAPLLEDGEELDEDDVEMIDDICADSDFLNNFFIDLKCACEELIYNTEINSDEGLQLEGTITFNRDYTLYASHPMDFVKILRQLASKTCIGSSTGLVDTPNFWDRPMTAFDLAAGTQEYKNPHIYTRAEKVLERRDDLLLGMKSHGFYANRQEALKDVLSVERVSSIHDPECLIPFGHRLTLDEVEMAVRSFEQDVGLRLCNDTPRLHMH